MAEEGLIEGVDAGREASIQAVDAGVKRCDIGAYFLAELGQVRADGFKIEQEPLQAAVEDVDEAPSQERRGGGIY